MTRKFILGSLLLLFVFACSREAELGGQSQLQMVNGIQVTTDDPLSHSVVALVKESDGESFCTGTLVHERLVITAAHCIYGKEKDSFRVLFEAADEESRLAVVAEKRSFMKSHKYDSNFDIAWLKLSHDAPSPYQAMELWFDPDSLEPGQALTMSGYGQQATHCSITQPGCKGGELQKVHTVLQEYVNQGRLYNLLLVGPTPGEGPCFGDSGGPLTIEENGQAYLLGNFMGWDKILVQEDDQHLCENGEAIYNAVGSYTQWIEASSGIKLKGPRRENLGKQNPIQFVEKNFDEDSFLEWCMYDDIRSPSWFTTQSLIRMAAEFARQRQDGIEGRELFEDCSYAQYWLEKMLAEKPILNFASQKFAKGNFDFLVEDLRPLKSLASYGVKELVLVNHGVDDLRPIATLKDLVKLVVMDNRPRDGAHLRVDLGPLKKLQHLVLYSPGGDLEGGELTAKPELSYLKLGYTNFKTWPKKMELPLKSLILTDVKGVNLASINLRQLESLELSSQKHVEFAQLMPRLRELRLYESEIGETVDFRKFPQLRQLHLQDSGVKSLSHINGAIHLEELFLMRNRQLKLVNAIAGLKDLQSVEIIDGQLEAIVEISACPKLQFVSLRGNQLLAVPQMEDLPELSSIDLEDNLLDSLDFAQPLPRVSQLNVSNNPLTSLESLSALPGIEVLLARNEKHKSLQSLQGIEALSKLKEINISHNQVDQLGPLKTHSQLEVIVLSHNQVESYEPLYGLSSVEYMEGVNNPAPQECPWTPSDKCRFEWFMLSI